MDEINTASHEIESQLVGSILRNGSVFPRIAEIVGAENLHSIIWQDVYRAMTQLHEAGIVIDQVTLGDQLQRNGTLDSIIFDGFTGRAALSKVRELGNAKNAESVATVVQDYWAKRELDALAPKLAMWSRNGRRSVDIIADMRTSFDAIYGKIGTTNSRTSSAKEAASRSYDETMQASTGEIRYVYTGIEALDSWFKTRDGNLTTVASRPGQGKTSLLVTMALNSAMDKAQRQANGRILFLSMEMTTEEVAARFLSQISRIPTTQILDGQMSPGEWERYNQAIEVFENLPIFINDLPAISIPQMRQEASRIFNPGEENVLMVDYVQLANSGSKTHNRVEEIGEITRGLKVFAQETRTPVIAAAQLNRNLESRAEKRPQLSDLREGGSIENDSNNVVFLYRDEEELNPDFRKIIVAKQRNGPDSHVKGDVDVRFIGPIMRFEDAHFQNIQLNPRKDID